LNHQHQKRDDLAIALLLTNVITYLSHQGILAKTDKLDAKVIHDYAITVSLDAASSRNDNQETSDLLNHKEQLIDMRIEESNRLETMTNKALIKSLIQTLH
jgi:hypothetical protein